MVLSRSTRSTVVSCSTYPCSSRRNTRFIIAISGVAIASITANSPNAIESLKSYVPENKLVLVQNALSAPDVKFLIPYEKKDKTILIVGRLHEQKAHHVLIESFAAIHASHKDWNLVVGDGPLREKLESLTETLGIESAVQFVGKTNAPYEYYAKASIFVLPSIHEGTPNALLEAMSCGVAPVISDTCEEAFPYVSHDKSGMIFPVNNVGALTDILDDLLSHEKKCKTLAQNAYESVEPLFTQSTKDLWAEALIR